MSSYRKLADAFTPGVTITITFRQPSALISVSGILHDRNEQGVLIETGNNASGKTPATRYLLFCRWEAIQSILFVPQHTLP